MIAVRIQQEVLDYLKLLAPQPRHALKVAIKNLAQEKGDIRALCDELEGFDRLRVGSNRVIFEYELIEGKRTITCVFAGPRKWIYEVFQNRIAE
jgi:mRNA interferase RelE/StbE